MLQDTQATPASPVARLGVRRLGGTIVAHRVGWGAVAVTSVAYLGLVLLLWLPLGWKDGMPYETAFAYSSETSTFWHGFFYADTLRPYTSVFYNVGYHLSKALGQGGSFIGFQIVYACLWWARGMLAFLIVDALFPRKRVFAALVGVLVLVQASDHAINWVGQMNQYGMIFWMLLSIYTLILALSAKELVWATLLMFLAMFFVRMTLWSYESPLFIVFIVPILLLVFRFKVSILSVVISAAYLAFPLVYAWDNFKRYHNGGAGSYQESVLRKDMSVGHLASDLWFNVKNSVEFWNWGWGLPVVAARHEQLWLGVGGALCAAAAVIAVAASSGAGSAVLPDRRTLAILLGSGAILLVASFPAYLILTSSRELWRTQFLSGIGTALVLSAVIGFVALATRSSRARVVVIAAAAGVIAYFGVSAAFAAASFHYGIWARHRTAMAEVLAEAPRVEPGTLLVLTGVPKDSDPFGDNMWFDVAVRLAYPHEPVAGIYFYRGGAPAPDENLKLHGTRWDFNSTGFAPILRRVPFANTIVIRYSPSGLGELLKTLPRFLLAPHLASLYNPATRIRPGPVPVFVRDRYGPIP